jgi:hypothetical protein
MAEFVKVFEVLQVDFREARLDEILPRFWRAKAAGQCLTIV